MNILGGLTMNDKYYAVYESIGNFSHMVFCADNFNGVQDYLSERFYNSGMDDEELFYSYFAIVEM